MASAGSVRWAILTAVGMTSLWPQGALRQMSHTSWTGRDGAPQGIHALAQTTDGYLWMGTLSGLYRFDGLRFTAYIPSPRDPQFNSLDTTALAADANNGLWAGFRVGGISYLKDGRLTNFDERSGLVTGYVGQIVIDGTGKVWAVAAGRLMKLVGARWEDVGARLGLAVGGVQSIFFDRSGHMWIAADGKISVLYRGQTKLAMMPETVKAVTQFLQARDGTIWISDGWKSVRPIGTADAARLTVPIRGTANLIFDSDGYLWIANDYFGVDAVKTAAAIEVEHFERDNGLTSNECRGILEDREGNIWIGTGLGLDRFQQSNFNPFTDVPLKSFPSFAAASDGTVWIGGLGSPLLSIRNGQTIPHGKNRGWGAMYAAPDGANWQYDYWSGRIWVIRGDEFEQIDAPPGIGRIAAQSITGDRQGALIVSFEYAGIWRRQGEQWEQVPIPGSSQDSVLSLLSDSAGRLWAGFANGQIGLLDLGKYKVFNAGGSVNLGSVMTLYEHSGRIWAGGTNGVVLYTEQGFRRLHPVEGIALRGVSGIVESREKDLWLNSASGIVRISSAEIEHALRDPAYKVQGEIFDFRDGVTGTPAQLRPTPTAIADTTGRLWFSSAGSVVSIDPSAIKRQRSLPQMALESLRSDGEVQSLAGKKSIPVGPRNLEIDYVGISLASPQRVIYRYRLDGEDRDWEDAGTRRQAVYSSLRPGRYRFRVAASIGDGRWNEFALPAEIVVPPAFYQTTWFAALCAIGLIAGLGIGHKVRVQHVTSRVRERLEERTAERVRLARDLHDTLLQGVQGLMLRFHFAAEQIPEREPARAMMEAALKAADRVIEEGRDHVRGLRSEGLNERDLPNALAQVGADLNWNQSVRFSVSVEGANLTLHPIVEDELYFIGREAIANAFRHANASQIQVEINADRKTICIRCRDNGMGMSPDILRGGGRDGHWGIRGMRERAERIGAKLDCWSTTGRGTEVVVTVSAKAVFASQRAHKTA